MPPPDSPIDQAREARARLAPVRRQRVKVASTAAERLRRAHRNAELAHRRAAEVHAKAADLFEKFGKPERAATERWMARRQLEGAESERDAQSPDHDVPASQDEHAKEEDLP